VAYNTDPTSTTPTSGFCQWQPPSPFQGEYTGDAFTPAAQSTADSWCFPPYQCQNILGSCNDNEPSYNQFVKYGDADVENDRSDSTDAAYTGMGAATAVEFFGAGLAAGIAGFALGGALVPALTGTALATALFPYATFLGDFALETSATLGAEVAGAAAAAAVGAIVAIVILAVAIAVLEGIQVTQGLAIPGQLAGDIANAASSPPDLQTMLQNSQQTTGLFGVFIGASLPNPTLQTCDNSNQTVLIGGTTAAPCLNAPPIPVETNTDPQFLITPKGSTQSSLSDTLNWTDVVSANSSGTPTIATQDTARVTGNWFVTHVNDSIPTATTTPDVQQLAIDYTDWGGTSHTAWLVKQSDGTYKFLTAEDGQQVNPSTCIADGTCAYSDSIDVEQYSSLESSTPTISDYSVSLTNEQPAITVSQQLGQSVLTEGSPATLDVAVSGGAGPFTEQWFFPTPESLPLSDCGGDQLQNCSWAGPFSGSQISYTPQAPGSLQGVVFVTDTGGREYEQTFTFDVADVGPTLTLGATDVHTTDLGGTTTLTLAVDHAGSNDTEGVNIDWGDGTTSSDTVALGQLNIIQPDFSFSLPSGTEIDFSATHVYANAGPYDVTVTDADGGGGSATQTTSETVNQASSGTGLTVSKATPVVGQSVTYTATVTASPDTPTGTVTFSEGATVLCADVALSATAPYTATCDHTYETPGAHTVSAVYNGDVNYIGSTSSGVTITALAPPAFTADSPATIATAGAAYSYTFAASGLPAPTFALASGALPPGLNLDGASGVLSGTPTTTGVFTFSVGATNGVSPDTTSPPLTITVAPAPDEGYWMATSDGEVFTFGDAAFFGSEGGSPLTGPVVAMANTPDGKGYWLATSNGWVFNFGDAAFYGSMGGTPLNKPVVAMVATPDGKGYWLATSDGGVFGFGDAAFYGSMGGTPLNKPVVAMAATPNGKGYWLAASDGGVFSFGDAAFLGSMGGTPLNKPVVAMAATPHGKGYWMAASDGGVFSFGDAGFFGSMGATPLNRPVIGMVPTREGKGYWMAASDGGVFNFGDAGFFGSEGGALLNAPIVALR
jgi:hypothetical protein